MKDGTLHVGSRLGITRMEHPLDPTAPHLQGDVRTPVDMPPNIIDEIAAIPDELRTLSQCIRTLVNLLSVATDPRPYANVSTLSNAAATALGTTSWAAAFASGYTDHAAVDLVDIVLGSDTPQTFQLAAINARTLDASVSRRIVGTIRTTAGALTQAFPTPVALHQGESLMLICTTAAAVNVDFSCRYRYQR